MVHHINDGTVEFAYFRPGARSVHIAGDFNAWQTDRYALKRDERGWWHIRLALTPGKHRFKYVVDGSIWEADYASYGVENDKHGGWNSVIWVDTPAADETSDLRRAA